MGWNVRFILIKKCLLVVMFILLSNSQCNVVLMLSHYLVLVHHQSCESWQWTIVKCDAMPMDMVRKEKIQLNIAQACCFCGLSSLRQVFQGWTWMLNLWICFIHNLASYIIGWKHDKVCQQGIFLFLFWKKIINYVFIYCIYEYYLFQWLMRGNSLTSLHNIEKLHVLICIWVNF
jgi:hypothetical protein